MHILNNEEKNLFDPIFNQFTGECYKSNKEAKKPPPENSSCLKLTNISNIFANKNSSMIYVCNIH